MVAPKCSSENLAELDKSTAPATAPAAPPKAGAGSAAGGGGYGLTGSMAPLSKGLGGGANAGPAGDVALSSKNAVLRVQA